MARCLVVIGSRTWPQDAEGIIKDALAAVPQDVLIVEGGATGVDHIAADVCRRLNRSFLEVPAQWKRFGRKAGLLRNRAMLDLDPDVVYAFSDTPITRETRECVCEALERGIPVRHFTMTLDSFVFRSLADLEATEEPATPLP